VSALSEDLGMHLHAQESLAGTVDHLLATRLHPPATPREKAVADEMVLYTQPADRDDPAKPSGLGSVQPNGRAQVLEKWFRPDPLPQLQVVQQPGRRPLEAQRPSLLRASTTPALNGGGAAAEGSGAGELEWSSLSDASKQALRQWVRGSLGGRHCMLVLEHGAGADSPMAPLSHEEPSVLDLRGSMALNVLSGLHAEVGLISGQEGGWLFEVLFSKTPLQALEEALQAALEEINDPRLERSSDLSPEQANLALRRRSMKVQFELLRPASQSAAGAGDREGGRNLHEHTRVQVWLELVRLHAEGVLRDGPPAVGREREKAPKGERPAGASASAWQDDLLLLGLGKAETELEAESQRMSLDALRSQNHAIEDYVMRLVRQRDELKNIAKLAEERDSYFILGLEGPHVTEDEIKKAYRKLSRKEHPDKAGTGNTRRFQQIQHAYSSVLRQRREGCSCIVAEEAGADGRPSTAAMTVGPSVTRASACAIAARDAADQVAICAHRTLRGSEESSDAQSLPKQRALRALREFTRQGIMQLRDAARQLRLLGEAVSSVAQCAEDAMNEHSEGDGIAVAGVGLRDRAVIAEDAGRSSLASAELLEKISEATEATLRKVERASPEAAGTSDGGSRQRAGRGEDAANLQRLGAKLLSESLARTAAVARRSADEAIAAALKALELSRGLAALDFEARKERERQEKRRRGFGDDEPVPAGDAEKADGERKEKGPGGKDDAEDGDDAPSATSPRSRPDTAGSVTPRDQLKSAAKRVKERHVALRVKNLLFLSSLNEEALRSQARLRSMLERSEGALLPEVSIMQKRRLFDLVAQLLDFALAEVARLAASPSAQPARVLERCLSFAFALEHGCEIAMPVDSKTQALKLAALVDSELLCQVVDGPFRRRLLALGAKRRAPGDAGLGRAPPYGRARSNSHLCTAASAKAWDDAAHSCCARISQAVRQALASPPGVGGDDTQEPAQASGGSMAEAPV